MRTDGVERELSLHRQDEEAIVVAEREARRILDGSLVDHVAVVGRDDLHP
jgi:hypothetical protein